MQAWTGRSGAPSGVLCNSVQELQKCMAPLVSLGGDDIAEASLLQPTGDECGTSPTLEEEAILLSEEVKPPEAPGSPRTLRNSQVCGCH